MMYIAANSPLSGHEKTKETRLNLKLLNFKKGIGIENATRNQQPSTIEIKRIEKLNIKKVWKQEGGCNYVDRTVILKHLRSLF